MTHPEPAGPDDAYPPVEVTALPLGLSAEVRTHPRFERPLEAGVRASSLLNSPPWVRSLGKLLIDVTTQGWRFPLPPDQPVQAPPRAAPEAKPQAGGELLPLS